MWTHVAKDYLSIQISTDTVKVWMPWWSSIFWGSMLVAPNMLTSPLGIDALHFRSCHWANLLDQQEFWSTCKVGACCLTQSHSKASFCNVSVSKQSIRTPQAWVWFHLWEYYFISFCWKVLVRALYSDPTRNSCLCWCGSNKSWLANINREKLKYKQGNTKI